MRNQNPFLIKIVCTNKDNEDNCCTCTGPAVAIAYEDATAAAANINEDNTHESWAAGPNHLETRVGGHSVLDPALHLLFRPQYFIF